jgi:hypothetical protein
MSRIMRRIFVLLLPGLLMGVWALAIAQAPPGEEPSDGADTGEPARPCVSAGEAILPKGVHGPPEPGAMPCEEQEPEAAPGEEQDSGDLPGEIVAGPEETGPEVKEEEDSAFEASADEEFTPVDEIPEDYPVPLPADI